MEIQLEAASEKDLEVVQYVFQASFYPLLQQYQNGKENPALISLTQLKFILKNKENQLLLVKNTNDIVGVVLVRQNKTAMIIDTIAILPKWQNFGIGKGTMTALEERFSETTVWQLDMILQESILIDFYEGLGYQATGEIEMLKEGLSIVHFTKEVEIQDGTEDYSELAPSSLRYFNQQSRLDPSRELGEYLMASAKNYHYHR